MQADAQVLAIVKAGERVSTAQPGDQVLVVLNQTPFYAQGGGQAGDSGVLQTAATAVSVDDTTKTPTGLILHHAVVANGELTVGSTVTAVVDALQRQATMCNHTAAHLLQAALRNVLGDHVEQAGQMVNDKEVRFDFTHFAPLTPQELAKVEEAEKDLDPDKQDQ